MKNATELTAGQLRQAADLKEKIAALERELNSLLGGTPTNSKPERAVAKVKRRKKKRQMSEEARAKIGAAQRLRWAKQKRKATG